MPLCSPRTFQSCKINVQVVKLQYLERTPGGGGGGGGFNTSICMHIGYVPRERPSVFSPKFLFRSIISFSHKNYDKQIRSGASPFYIFCRSGDHHFPNFFNFNPFTASHGRLSLNAKRVRQRPGLAAGQSASQTRPNSSGDPHFHAQNGSSSFRSPTFSRSTVELVPEPRPIFFTLPRHIQCRPT